MKRGIQIALVSLAIVASVYGIVKMSAETKTLILPAWLIIAFASLIVLLVSMTIGFLAKLLLELNWHQMTLTSIVIIRYYNYGNCLLIRRF